MSHDPFRLQVRAWLETYCPQPMRQPMTEEFGAAWGGRNPEFSCDSERGWLLNMAQKGWIAPQWPVAFGGAGLSREEADILQQELDAIGARPPLIGSGLWMLGPVLLEYGTEDQKRRHLPPIARGEVRWAQGYSEPNAGSDLASLKLRADLVGDAYVLNGSKIWSSYADKSDWMFLLARTDFNAPQHQGISFLLVDLTAPGITRRPIKLIDGTHDFCEVFFDNVRAQADDLVGLPGQGWTIAKKLMDYERLMIGAASFAPPPAQPGALGRSAKGIDDNAMLRAQIAQYDIDAFTLDWTNQRIRAEMEAGLPLVPAMASVTKLMGAVLEIEGKELVLKAHGSDALSWPVGSPASDRALAKDFLRARSSAIAGGTNEIQLNIIAKHALGM
jgi:acyl-CoA dehydrogenase